MPMNEHPHDSIPAFVLGTLDVEEALIVSVHIKQCATCRDEVESFQSILSTLPYAAVPQHPPRHVKQELLARIAASGTSARSAALATAPARAQPRWMQMATGAALMLTVVFGLLLYDMNGRMATLSGKLGQNEHQLAQLNSQGKQDQTAIAHLSGQHQQDQSQLASMRDELEQDKQITTFMAAAQPVVLSSPNQRTSATMYMQPGNKRAVLAVAGMPPAQPGKTYQLWLGRPGVQVPSETFDVDQNGVALLMIDAPLPVNEYRDVMVTVEPSGGGKQPSDQVMLSAPLDTAPSGLAPVLDGSGRWRFL